MCVVRKKYGSFKIFIVTINNESDDFFDLTVEHIIPFISDNKIQKAFEKSIFNKGIVDILIVGFHGND